MKRIMASLAVMTSLTLVASAGEGWGTDFEAAKKAAVEKNLPILVDFSGSDWCGWCIKLDKEVFSKPEFKAYAKDNLVTFLADFPRRSQIDPELEKSNRALAEKYGVRGFPTVLLLDAEGKVLGRTGYQRGGPEAYVKHLKELLAESQTPAAPPRPPAPEPQVK